MGDCWSKSRYIGQADLGGTIRRVRHRSLTLEVVTLKPFHAFNPNPLYDGKDNQVKSNKLRTKFHLQVLDCLNWDYDF